MLKKDMQGLLNRREMQLTEMTGKIKDLQGDVKSYQDDAKKHTKLKLHVDKALCAIEAIKVTSCRNEIAPDIRFHISQDAINNDKPEPNLPPLSELYVSLGHIEEILNRPVEEVKKDTRYGF